MCVTLKLQADFRRSNHNDNDDNDDNSVKLHSLQPLLRRQVVVFSYIDIILAQNLLFTHIRNSIIAIQLKLGHNLICVWSAPICRCGGWKVGRHWVDIWTTK